MLEVEGNTIFGVKTNNQPIVYSFYNEPDCVNRSNVLSFNDKFFYGSGNHSVLNITYVPQAYVQLFENRTHHGSGSSAYSGHISSYDIKGLDCTISFMVNCLMAGGYAGCSGAASVQLRDESNTNKLTLLARSSPTNTHTFGSGFVVLRWEGETLNYYLHTQIETGALSTSSGTIDFTGIECRIRMNASCSREVYSTRENRVRISIIGASDYSDNLIRHR